MAAANHEKVGAANHEKVGATNHAKVKCMFGSGLKTYRITSMNEKSD